eukprot:365667-Chlamydomonas_euryale.AAC.3
MAWGSARYHLWGPHLVALTWWCRWGACWGPLLHRQPIVRLLTMMTPHQNRTLLCLRPSSPVSVAPTATTTRAIPPGGHLGVPSMPLGTQGLAVTAVAFHPPCPRQPLSHPSRTSPHPTPSALPPHVNPRRTQAPPHPTPRHTTPPCACDVRADRYTGSGPVSTTTTSSPSAQRPRTRPRSSPYFSTLRSWRRSTGLQPPTGQADSLGCCAVALPCCKGYSAVALLCCRGCCAVALSYCRGCCVVALLYCRDNTPRWQHSYVICNRFSNGSSCMHPTGVVFDELVANDTGQRSNVFRSQVTVQGLKKAGGPRPKPQDMVQDQSRKTSGPGPRSQDRSLNGRPQQRSTSARQWLRAQSHSLNLLIRWHEAGRFTKI